MGDADEVGVVVDGVGINGSRGQGGGGCIGCIMTLVGNDKKREEELCVVLICKLYVLLREDVRV